MSSWRYAPERREIVCTDDAGERYSVDVERMRTCAEVLDWIYQVAGKGWISNESLGQLVREINRVLHPQATLCSCGKDRGRIDPVAVAAGSRS